MIKMIKNDKNRLTLATVTQGHVLWLTMYKRTKGCCLCSSLLLLLPVSSFSNAIHISFVRYRSLAYCVNLISHISTTL